MGIVRSVCQSNSQGTKGNRPYVTSVFFLTVQEVKCVVDGLSIHPSICVVRNTASVLQFDERLYWNCKSCQETYVAVQFASITHTYEEPGHLLFPIFSKEAFCTVNPYHRTFKYVVG